VAWLSLEESDSRPASFWTYVITARVRQAEGDLDGALDLLDDAQRGYTGDFSPNVRRVPALRARVLADLGRVWMVVKGFKPSPITAERAHEADCVSTSVAAR
jgi:hypothetical protein